LPEAPAARPSLLWPGQVRRRLERWDWWLLGAAYVLAVAVRWTIRDAGPYTAEAAHYALSRHLWHGVDNVASLFPDVRPDDFSWFFWQRPLLCLLYWPAAQGGFAVYRAAHILVAGTVPVLAAILLRQMGARPAYAHGAAAVLAVHPVLVPWGVLVLPDTTVAALTLAGLLAAHDGRPWATAGLLLAGSWVKEVGFVTAAALFVLAAWREADGSRARPWPLRLGRFSTLMLAVALLSFLPLAVSLALPYGTPPGFRIGGGLDQSLERQFLLLWLAPLPLVGLLAPRVRRLCLVALAWPAFFVFYHLVTGKAIEVWYNVVPATLVLVASAATLDALPREGPPLRRWASTAVSVAFAALLVVQVAVPSGATLNRAVATPLSHVGQWDLREALAYEEVRGDGLDEAVARIPAGHDGAWLALDVDYSLVMFPLAEHAGVVYKDYTMEWDMTDGGLRWWADAVENRTDATLLGGTPDSLSRALVEAYAPCAATFDTYSVIVPDSCHGYGDRLIAAWHHQRSMASQPPP
jgi:hypothetical protein